MNFSNFRPSFTQYVTFEQRRIDFDQETIIYWNIEYLGAINDSNATWDEPDSSIDNNIIFSPNNGSVSVKSTGDFNEGKAVIDVTNNGDRKTVFYYRLSLNNCSVNDTQDIYQCSIVYPSQLYIRVDTRESSNQQETTTYVNQHRL